MKDLADRIGQWFELPDGRHLGYDDLGPVDGAPVFYFHGVPSSRLDLHMFAGEGLVEPLGVRLIAVDRPGCGLSDFQRGRRLRDWPTDVAALADSLGIERFEALGWSGGGPYALACAAMLPRRITAATVVSCVGPQIVTAPVEGINAQSVRFFRLNRDRPVLGRLLDSLMLLGARRGPEKFLAKTVAALPATDQDAMSRPDVGRAYIGAVLECFRQGTRGPQVDAALVVSEWGFDPARIDVPVYLWHGGQDTEAPVIIGHLLAEAIPGCQAQFLADEGHISLIVNHAESILRHT